MKVQKCPLITNPHDPRFRSLRFLQTPRGRSETGQYVIEGIRHLARAVHQQASIQSVFFEPSVLVNPFGQKLARQLRRRGVPAMRLTLSLYMRLTLAAEPQGIGATLRQQWTTTSRLHVGPNTIWLALESIESPGNLGTIIRTAEAAGVEGIFLLGEQGDPYHPAAVRASMGSLFAQRLIRCSVREFADWARSNGVCIVGSSPGGLMDYKGLRYSWPAALLVGSEKKGLSELATETARFVVRIPMHGHCDSVNVAVATGVVLFEMSSQRAIP